MKKTSAQWAKEYEKQGITILDPDGWDRINWEFSWEEEKISKTEFEYRLKDSTIICKFAKM